MCVLKLGTASDAVSSTSKTSGMVCSHPAAFALARGNNVIQMAFPPSEQIFRTTFYTESYWMCTPVTLSKQKPYTSHSAIRLHSPGLREIYVSSLSCQKNIPSGGARHQIFKACDRSRFNKERRTDVNLKGGDYGINCETKSDTLSNLFFNINNIRNDYNMNKCSYFSSRDYFKQVMFILRTAKWILVILFKVRSIDSS